MIVTKDATHISVVVKGSKGEALRAGHARGIPLRYVRATAHGESVCIADMEYRTEIMRWYNSAGAKVLPVGTPLVFSETHVSPYKTRD